MFKTIVKMSSSVLLECLTTTKTMYQVLSTRLSYLLFCFIYSYISLAFRPTLCKRL